MRRVHPSKYSSCENWQLAGLQGQATAVFPSFFFSLLFAKGDSQRRHLSTNKCRSGECLLVGFFKMLKQENDPVPTYM